MEWEREEEGRGKDVPRLGSEAAGQSACGRTGEEGVVPGPAAEEGGSLISPSLKPTVKTVCVCYP